LPDVVRDVIAILEAHPAVRKVSFVGSRARGDATPFSDWDFRVETDDFPSLAPELPSLVEPLRPLVAQWDRLSDEQCYMLIVDGPQKVDFLFDEPHAHEPPHVASAETLSAIDAHFWDWTLWLTSKVASGKDDVVRTELAKMTDHVLGPLGAGTPPKTLSEAVDVYLAVRDEHEQRFDVRVPREPGAQVVRRIRDQASPG
jgi:hypothetical protein